MLEQSDIKIKAKKKKNLYLSLTCYTKINSKLDYGLTHKMQNCKT